MWPTKKLARVETGKWIKGRYNRRRRHALLGHVSLFAFGWQYLANTTAPKKNRLTRVY